MREALGKVAGRLTGWQRVVVVTLLAAMLVAGSTAGAAASGGSATILRGVRVDGVDVGGMTRLEAISALQAHVKPILNRSVVVVAAGHRWQVSPAQLGRQAAVELAVARAMDGPRLGWLARAWHRVAGQPVTLSLPLDYSGAGQRAAADFARKVAPSVALAPVDAVFALEQHKVVQRHARAGRQLDLAAATRVLAGALRPGGPSTVSLPLRTIAPKVSDKGLGLRIVIDKTNNTLDLYDGFHVMRHYDVATAKAGFVTPSGTWHVVTKQVNPTWVNPAPNGWGKDEPLVIPPGPGNPLGTRALGLDAAGIFIHGTPSDWSIGSHASHGCIRMHISQAEELYPLVPLGTTVLIHS